MVAPASPVPRCWSGFVRRAAVGDVPVTGRIICHAGDNRLLTGGVASIVLSGNPHWTPRCYYPRRIGGVKLSDVATVCKRRLRRETPRAVAIHRRVPNGRGITVKIDVSSRLPLRARSGWASHRSLAAAYRGCRYYRAGHPRRR